MGLKMRTLFLVLTVVFSIFLFSGEACFDIGTPTEPDELITQEPGSPLVSSSYGENRPSYHPL